MRCPGWRIPQIAPMLAAFEEIMAGCGWEKVVPAIGNEAIGTKVYDLLPGQIFTLSDGEQITLEDLERLARRGVGLGDHGEGPLKGYASLWDPSTGGGAAFEHQGFGDLRQRGAVPVRHQIRGAAPLEAPRAAEGFHRTRDVIAGAGEGGVVMSKQIKRPMPERPDDAEKDLNVKTGWLLKTYAFCPPLDKVVDMYKAHAIDCLLKRDAFVFTFRGWNEPRRGASGSILVKPKLATDDGPTTS